MMGSVGEDPRPRPHCAGLLHRDWDTCPFHCKVSSSLKGNSPGLELYSDSGFKTTFKVIFRAWLLFRSVFRRPVLI